MCESIFQDYPTNGGNMPTCQSRRIAVRSLSGAFAYVLPRRASIDEPIFSPNGSSATLIMNSTTSKVGLEAYIQHWTFSHDWLKDAGIVKGCQYSQRMLVQEKDTSIVKGCQYSKRMLAQSKDATSSVVYYSRRMLVQSKGASIQCKRDSRTPRSPEGHPRPLGRPCVFFGGGSAIEGTL